MTEEIYDYNVRCKTCLKSFTVQLFDSHEKNLFIVDKKDWYCEPCKKDYFARQAESLTKEHEGKGFSELSGTDKMVSWAVKIRSELINKVEYLKNSLTFSSDEEKEASDSAFNELFSEWHKQTKAKWWIDNRRMTVRDISMKVDEFKKGNAEND